MSGEISSYRDVDQSLEGKIMPLEIQRLWEKHTSKIVNLGKYLDERDKARKDKAKILSLT